MGKYNKGILGSFTGQVGTVVGSSWKGIEVMKSRNKTRKKPPTARQIAQRARFSFVGTFIKPLAKLLNMAFRYNYRHALKGSNGEYKIDYAKVMISSGDLHPSVNTVAEVMDNTVKFSWNGNSDHTGTNPNDKTILVNHCRRFSNQFTDQAAPGGLLEQIASTHLYLAAKLWRPGWLSVISKFTGSLSSLFSQTFKDSRKMTSLKMEKATIIQLYLRNNQVRTAFSVH